MAMISLDKVPIPNPDVISRVVSNETILVNPPMGEVKVLNEVGTRIWSLVDGRISIREIANLICLEYQIGLEDAQDDIIEFIEQLVERNAITLSDVPMRRESP